jgi:LPS sulfotransferase NodH
MERLLAAIGERQARTVPQQGNAPDGLPAFFPGLRYLWLQRENKVAQAISHYIAKQTGIWQASRNAAQPPGVPPDIEYDFLAIKELVSGAQAADAGWRAFLAGSEDRTLKLTYEELAADYAGVVARVLHFLGFPLSADDVPPPSFQKQADARSMEWEQRFRDEERSLEYAADAERA